MKVDLLKKLIKEAVKEAVREELAIVLAEPATRQPKQAGTVTKYESYAPIKKTTQRISTGDPLMDLLNETRGEMQGQAPQHTDMSQYVEAPGLGMQMMTEDQYGPSSTNQYYQSAAEPGIDISQLSFVKKAAAVFNESVKKDKERFGG